MLYLKNKANLHPIRPFSLEGKSSFEEKLSIFFTVLVFRMLTRIGGPEDVMCLPK